MDPNVKYLTDEEIKQFMKELDSDNDGLIAYHEVEAKLDEVYREIGREKIYSN
jgi:Ca2+-binding EF-hand superfamily protein